MLNTLTRFAATLLALFVFGLALAGDSIPFKGTGSGMVIGVNPQPTYLELTITATGQSTLLGHYTRYEVIQVDGVGGITGIIDFTAANGDVLTVSVAGQFTSATTVDGTYTVTGGTGRFAGETGSADFHVVSPDGIHIEVEFNGLVSRLG